MALAEQRRIDILSRVRSIPAGYNEDRRSVYWENGIPAKDYTKPTSFVLTDRQNQLVYSKALHHDYHPNRPSAIWPIHPATLKALCTPRLQDLSQPKQFHELYCPPKAVRQPISRHALSAHASSRLRQLAQHKLYSKLEIKKNTEWDWGEWDSGIHQETLHATPSPRVLDLAMPKSVSRSYQPSRSVKWPVPKSALSHTAGERLMKLAVPKQLTGYQEDYDYNAYKVSKAALLAMASPCIENLAKPIPRKCRQKKNV